MMARPAASSLRPNSLVVSMVEVTMLIANPLFFAPAVGATRLTVNDRAADSDMLVEIADALECSLYLRIDIVHRKKCHRRLRATWEAPPSNIHRDCLVPID